MASAVVAEKEGQSVRTRGRRSRGHSRRAAVRGLSASPKASHRQAFAADVCKTAIVVSLLEPRDLRSIISRDQRRRTWHDMAGAWRIADEMM